MLNRLGNWVAGMAAVTSLAFVQTAFAASCSPLLQHTFTGLFDGKPQSLCRYQGKVILVVNTASQCGYTPQYDGLQKLYARLKDKGFVVLGFPSNDFAQEPGANKEIADFCRLNYGVDFPMFGKTTFKGKDANPFYQKLSAATGSRPAWNFHKYLINRDASKVLAYGSATTAEDKALLQQIHQFLK